jgi:MFS transporter, DHA2 family, multidrug resistance protein
VLISGGLALSVAAQTWLAFQGPAGGPAPVALAFALTNLGAGPMITLTTGLVLGAVPPERAGAAGALNETSGEFGFALGIAALGSLGVAVYRATIALPPGLPPAAVTDSRDTLAGATAAAAHLPADQARAVLTTAHEAFTTGMQVAAGLSAVLLAALAVTIAVALRRVPPLGEHTPASE